MDYQELLRKRDAYQEGKHLIPELTIASYERAFEIEYTHGHRGEHPDADGDKAGAGGQDQRGRQTPAGTLRAVKP